MNTLITELIAGIKNIEEEAFIGASEVAAASNYGYDKYEAIEPYNERINTEPPSNEDVEALKSALIAYVNSASNPAGSAAFALGKFYDPTLTPVLRNQLAKQLKELLKCNSALSNLITALDNSGEDIISNGSHSIMETEKMIADARAYLEKHGQVLPW